MEIIKEDLQKYYIEEGHTMKETANFFHCAKSTIWKLAVQYGLTKVSANQKQRDGVDKDQLYNFYILEDHSLDECANEFGYSKSMIKKYLNDYQIRKMTDTGIYNKVELSELYLNQNLTMQELAEHYGVSIESIINILNKYNIRKNIDQRMSNVRKGCAALYGVDNYFKTPEGRVSISNGHSKIGSDVDPVVVLWREQWIANNKPIDDLIDFIKTHFSKRITVFELAEFLGYSNPSVLYTYLKNNKIDNLDDIIETNPPVSSDESSIRDWLQGLGVTVQCNDRVVIAPLELDMFLPEYGIAIEYNGNYWHSSLMKEQKYHLKKSEACAAKDIRLIHIYEYEWKDPIKQNIIKSLIKIALGKVENRIYARQCEVRKIDNKIAKSFNDYNHLQGHKNAQVTYGLYYQDNLVQLMSFTYYPRKGWWEIERGCPGSNNIVVGGVSKLFKHFVKEHNPDKVFSYCDFNKFDGKGYEALGMKYIGMTGPDMKWLLPGGVVVNRAPSKHDELQKQAIGKIWGAGSKKYLWIKEELNRD